MQVYKDKILQFFYNKEWYERLADKLLTIFLILIAAYIINKIVLILVDYIVKTSLRANRKLGLTSNNKRTDTIRKLIKSIITYTVYFIVFIEILAVFGINTTGILASAGLVSVAVGFGAQSLVKDIITGFFLILEGQFDVGDYIKISNQAAFIAEGRVVALGLKSTKLLSDSGEVYFIPNSSINQVINYSQTYNLAAVDFSITLLNDYKTLESEVLDLITTLNTNEIYTNNFYKEEKLHIVELKSIENNIAKITVGVKALLTKNDIVETLLKKDFYDKFRDRLV